MAIGFSVNLVDWENGASFEDQSHNELRQNQSNSGQFSTFNLKLLKRGNNDSRFLEKKRREFIDVHTICNTTTSYLTEWPKSKFDIFSPTTFCAFVLSSKILQFLRHLRVNVDWLAEKIVTLLALLFIQVRNRWKLARHHEGLYKWCRLSTDRQEMWQPVRVFVLHLLYFLLFFSG